MKNTPLILERFWDRGTPCPFDEVIDVRSPGEFAEDHVPGAINLPVFSDAERAEVGTQNAVAGSFAARRSGAGLVARNIARHFESHFVHRPREYRPLIYCWRGGQRSASLATVLSEVGWRVTVLKGGYKTYRAHVLQELKALPARYRFRLLAGMTGTAKTRILHHLATRGAQIIDLEGMAGHRGSVLGRLGAQPSQKAFDSRLLAELEILNPGAPVWIEAESHRIGDLYLPLSLWNAMKGSDGVEIRMPVAARIEHLVSEYAHLIADPERLKRELGRLAPLHGRRRASDWLRLIDAGQWSVLVEDLLRSHYDPGYAASHRRTFSGAFRIADLAKATDGDLDALADELVNAGAADPAGTET